jgi:hypothetical protein
MTLQQKIKLADEIWLSMCELQKYIPGYMVALNLNPEFILKSKSKREISSDLSRYIDDWSDYIKIARVLRENLK